MKKINVKEYMDITGKSDKTVYNMIKDRRLKANKKSGGYEVFVDKHLYKALKELQKECENLKKLLHEKDKKVKENTPDIENRKINVIYFPKNKKVARKKVFKKSGQKKPLRKVTKARAVKKRINVKKR